MKDISGAYTIEKCKAYLNERGFPQGSRILDQCNIEFAAAPVCYAALNKKVQQGDKRLGIIFHYPETDYATVRWMGTYTNAWGQVKGADRKLECPSGDKPPVYIPSIVDWEEFNGTLYICESVLKSLVMATRGYAAIAGNGIFGLFNKHGWAHNFPHHLIDSVKQVAILFDNDYKRNPHVQTAIRKLGNAFKERHPDVEIVHKPLPDPPVNSRFWDESRGKHKGLWGVDDAIALNGDEWLKEWLEEPDHREIESTELQLHFDELNEQYAVCRNPDVVVELATGNLYKRNSFTDLIEAPRTVFINDKPAPVARLWIKSHERTIVDTIAYKPGEDKLKGTDYYNSWRDDGVRPLAPPPDHEGSPEDWVEPFLRVYKNAVPDTLCRQLLLDSMAYIVQNRGARMEKSFLLIGDKQGTGKSLMVQVMGKIVGRSNFASIGESDFRSDFNSAYTAKEVVLMDDIYKMNETGMAKLKRCITDETIMVNPKGVQQYEIENHAVYFLTSNEYVALPFDDNDRRILTVHFDPTVHHPTGSKWWDEYLGWLNDGGYAKIRWWLGQLDITKFNPNFLPPMTQAKRHMIQASMSPEEQWVQDLVDDPDIPLYGNKRSAYTPEELWMLYTSSGEMPTRKEITTFGMAIGKHFFRANNGKVVRIKGGVSRYWVVRGDGREWDANQVKEDVSTYPNLTLG